MALANEYVCVDLHHSRVCSSDVQTLVIAGSSLVASLTFFSVSDSPSSSLCCWVNSYRSRKFDSSPDLGRFTILNRDLSLHKNALYRRF